MKKIPLFLIAFCYLSNLSVFSQRNTGTLYAFDENWKEADDENAVYLKRQKKINDTCWQWDTYFYKGPIIKSERFKDKKGTILNGRTILYSDYGVIAAIRYYYNGLLDTTWQQDAENNLFTEKRYSHGYLTTAFKPLKKQRSSSASSASNNELPTSPEGPEDAAFTKTETQSSFHGGIPAWQKYLSNNLKYPDRAFKAQRAGNVVVQFVVDKEGVVTDPILHTSIEFSLDEEALRIIRSSGKWTPAVQNGQTVISYKKQPIAFRLK